MSLDAALGRMKSINQFFVWRMVWDAAAAKYAKCPCALDGSVYRIDASLPANWNTYINACSALALLPGSADRTVVYALGFWLTADSGYWFLDLDKCSNGDGVLDAASAAMVAKFPGALMEWSSSKRGAHVIGSSEFDLPPHCNRSGTMEFYTSDRGIAFGLDGEAQGDADSWHDDAIAQLIVDYFPPRAVGDVERRSEWRGPEDDDTLIARALASKQSAESAFGGKASFGQLWRGEVEKTSEHDMALASHLAFWTGCDAERMERLMRKSGLVRAKWNEHRTYLRELTIANACAGCSAVYQEPQRALVEVVSAASSDDVTKLLDAISACGTLLDMQNVVIPLIRATNVPVMFAEKLVRAVNARLEVWDAKMPIGRLRMLVCPPVIAGSRGSNAPAWVQMHCYVKEGDFFYNVVDGSRLSYQGMIAEYTRDMPFRESGGRENPVEWAFSRWGIRTVHHVGYRPDMPAYFEWDGLEYANLYSAASVPMVASAYTAAGLEGIDALQRLMFDMCGRRMDVFLNLLWWFAHNVQHPGVKIRWAPIIKGPPGDAKSLLTVVLRSAMGYRNVGVTGNATLTASGGFNDWAIGYAVNFIEEIMLTGKERHRLYNAMKEFITNDVININAKGSKTYMTYNTTNHFATTNHNDSLPLERNDRRWFVIFTPWSTLADMYSYCGLTEGAWKARTRAIDHAMRNCAGELRAWFLGLQIDAAFDIQSSAMMTPEKMRMMASSQDDAEAVAAQIISEGGYGITESVVSSSCLSHQLKIRAMSDGFDLPRGMAMNHLMTRMGFSRLESQVKWRGVTHTIWIRNGFSEHKDAVRIALDGTQTITQTLITS